MQLGESINGSIQQHPLKVWGRTCGGEGSKQTATFTHLQQAGGKSTLSTMEKSDVTHCIAKCCARHLRTHKVPGQRNAEACGANLFTHYDTLVLVTVYHLGKSSTLVTKHALRCSKLLFIGGHCIQKQVRKGAE